MGAVLVPDISGGMMEQGLRRRRWWWLDQGARDEDLTVVDVGHTPTRTGDGPKGSPDAAPLDRRSCDSRVVTSVTVGRQS